MISLRLRCIIMVTYPVRSYEKLHCKLSIPFSYTAYVKIKFHEDFRGHVKPQWDIAASTESFRLFDAPRP